MENAEFYETSYYNGEFTPEKRVSDAKNGDYFIVDELLNLTNDENMVAADGGGGGGLEVAADAGGASPDSSITPVGTSCNSSKPHYHAADIGGSRSFADGHFSSELCVPYDDVAELEWLSNFVEESFSSDDLQKLQLIQGMKARNNHEASETHQAQYHFQPETIRPGPLLPSEMSVPAKARSKRSRAPPLTWTSRLLVVSPTPPSPAVPAISSSSESDVTTGKKSINQAINKKKEVPENNATGGGDGRRCQHCATDKTPQWRTGPMGPKTLCNACGVRYKSGRLVPEYRPASSPTFVLTKHSNSHRKVLELRRQKEMMRAQQHQHEQQHFMHHHHQGMMFDVSNGDDYLIHQHIGPDFRQLNI